MNDKILLVFEDNENIEKLKTSLIENDFQVESLSEINVGKVHPAINNFNPDAIVFYYKQARPEIADIAKYIQSTTPTPIIVFSDESETSLVSNTIDSGATAFIVDGIESHRIPPIIDAAKARFNKCQSLIKKLDTAETKLESRKDIDRAKGILMDSKKISEDEAYNLLRSMAMNLSLIHI